MIRPIFWPCPGKPTRIKATRSLLCGCRPTPRSGANMPCSTSTWRAVTRYLSIRLRRTYCVRPPPPARPDSESDALSNRLPRWLRRHCCPAGCAPVGTQFLRPRSWRYFLRMARLLYAVATVGIVLGCASCACSPDVTPPTPKKSATTSAKKPAEPDAPAPEPEPEPEDAAPPTEAPPPPPPETSAAD